MEIGQEKIGEVNNWSGEGELNRLFAQVTEGVRGVH